MGNLTSDCFITLDLSKKEFVSLICSYYPLYADMDRFIDAGFGVYAGDHDEWFWRDSALLELPDDDFISLYFYMTDHNCSAFF